MVIWRHWWKNIVSVEPQEGSGELGLGRSDRWIFQVFLSRLWVFQKNLSKELHFPIFHGFPAQGRSCVSTHGADANAMAFYSESTFAGGELNFGRQLEGFELEALVKPFLVISVAFLLILMLALVARLMWFHHGLSLVNSARMLGEGRSDVSNDPP